MKDRSNLENEKYLWKQKKYNNMVCFNIIINMNCDIIQKCFRSTFLIIIYVFLIFQFLYS